MSYVGNAPAVAYTNTVKDTFSGDNSTVAFTLSVPSTTNNVRVVVENVIQDPTVAYSVSGTTLTFTSAPPSGTNNIYVVHLGPAVQTVVPPDSVTITDLNAYADGAVAFTANRASSDGTIIDVQKDGSSVGSIGTLFGDLYVATGNTGIRCVDANRSISAYDSSAGALVDAAVDLGYASVRYKDLYLSGGVYLGGTGSANLLDDYEEGTWTPAFSSNFGVVTYSGQHGYYTKVGRLVTANFHLNWTARSTSGGAYGVNVENLPFTAPNLVARTTGGVLAVSGFENIPMGAGHDSRTHGSGYINKDTNTFALRFSSLSASEVSPDGSSGTYTGGGYYYGFLQYWVS